MNKKKNLSISVMLLMALSIGVLCASYGPWLGYKITETPERIMRWYPRFGGIWLVVRGFIKPVAAILLAGGGVYFLWPWFQKTKAFIGNRKTEIKERLWVAVKSFPRIMKFSAYTIGAVVLIFAGLNLLCFFGLKNDGHYRQYYQQLHQVINPNAYYHAGTGVPLDSNYLEENIEDNIRYTFLSNGEFDYYPRLETVHALHSSRHIHVAQPANDLPNRLTLPLNSVAEKVIYCFGGSTTFGTLISDEHTWPSFLMKIYKDSGEAVLVKNYGYCGHNASQSTQAFLELLRLGHRPSVAIFMDGINVGPPFDGCEYSQGIADRFEYNETATDVYKAIYGLPFFKWLMPEKSIGQPSLEKKETIELILATDSANNRRYANRLMENAALRKKIGELYGVQVISFLQPNVFYDYNRSYTTPLFQKAFPPTIFANYRTIYSTASSSNQYINLSNLFSEYGQPAVIDLLHYSPDFNRYLAEKISGCFAIDTMPPYKWVKKEASNLSFDKDR